MVKVLDTQEDTVIVKMPKKYLSYVRRLERSDLPTISTHTIRDPKQLASEDDGFDEAVRSDVVRSKLTLLASRL